MVLLVGGVGVVVGWVGLMLGLVGLVRVVLVVVGERETAP